MKPEHGRCRATIRTAIIVNGERGRKYIRVFLRGQGNEPAIVMPEDIARQYYALARKPGSPVLYTTADMMTQHARILCKWLQGRECIVRVSHEAVEGYWAGNTKHYWNYRVWSVKP